MKRRNFLLAAVGAIPAVGVLAKFGAGSAEAGRGAQPVRETPRCGVITFMEPGDYCQLAWDDQVNSWVRVG